MVGSLEDTEIDRPMREPLAVYVNSQRGFSILRGREADLEGEIEDPFDVQVALRPEEDTAVSNHVALAPCAGLKHKLDLMRAVRIIRLEGELYENSDGYRLAWPH